jgi:uncharacterized protein YbbC (DUF1343 family)
MINRVQIPRRYFSELADAVDNLINAISIWEGDNFSASGVGLTRREAEVMAAHFINEALVSNLLCPMTLDGSKLLDILRQVRGGNLEVSDE